MASLTAIIGFIAGLLVMGFALSASRKHEGAKVRDEREKARADGAREREQWVQRVGALEARLKEVKQELASAVQAGVSARADVARVSSQYDATRMDRDRLYQQMSVLGVEEKMPALDVTDEKARNDASEALSSLVVSGWKAAVIADAQGLALIDAGPSDWIETLSAQVAWLGEHAATFQQTLQDQLLFVELDRGSGVWRASPLPGAPG